jgi:WD40 repeat protein
MPRRICTDDFVPTALVFAPNDKSIVVGTSDGEIRIFHRRHGFLPPSESMSELAQLVRASGPIRHLDFVRSGGDIHLVVAQKKRITLWSRGVEEGAWEPCIDLSYIRDGEAETTGPARFDQFSGDILDLVCFDSPNAANVQTCHLVESKTGDPSIRVQFKFLRNNAYERHFGCVAGDPIPIPSPPVDDEAEDYYDMVSLLSPMCTQYYGEPGVEETLDKWVIFAPNADEDIVSMCSCRTEDGETIVATVDSTGTVTECSGWVLESMILYHSGFSHPWELEEWLGEDCSKTHIGTIPISVSHQCLKYNSDGTMLAAGMDFGDGSGAIKIWNLLED